MLCASSGLTAVGSWQLAVEVLIEFRVMRLLVHFTLCVILVCLVNLGTLCLGRRIPVGVEIRNGIASLTWHIEIRERKAFTIFQEGSGTAALTLDFERTSQAGLLKTKGRFEFWEGGTVYAEFVKLQAFGFVDVKNWRMVLMDIESVREDSVRALERARLALGLSALSMRETTEGTADATPTRDSLVLSAMNSTMMEIARMAATTENTESRKSTEKSNTMSTRLCPYMAMFRLDSRTTSVLNGSFNSERCETKLRLRYSPFPLIRKHYRVTFNMFVDDLCAQLEDFITSNSTMIFLYFFQFILTLRQIRSSRKAPRAVNPLFLAFLVVSTLSQDMLRRKVISIGSHSDIAVIGAIIGCASAYTGWLMECLNLRRLQARAHSNGSSSVNSVGGAGGVIGAAYQTRSFKMIETSLWLIFIVLGVAFWAMLPTKISKIYHLIVSVCFFLSQLLFGRPGFLHTEFVIVTCATCLIGLIFTQADESSQCYQLHLIITLLSSICIISQAVTLVLEKKRIHRREYNEIRSGQVLDE